MNSVNIYSDGNTVPGETEHSNFNKSARIRLELWLFSALEEFALENGAGQGFLFEDVPEIQKWNEKSALDLETVLNVAPNVVEKVLRENVDVVWKEELQFFGKDFEGLGV